MWKSLDTDINYNKMLNWRKIFLRFFSKLHTLNYRINSEFASIFFFLIFETELYIV